jgi:hypothetical protein
MKSPWKAKRRKHKSAETANQIVTVSVSGAQALVHKFGNGEQVEVEESEEEQSCYPAISNSNSPGMRNDGGLVTQLLEMSAALDLHMRQLRRLRVIADGAGDTKRLHMIDVLSRKHARQRLEVGKMQSQPFVDPGTFGACQEGMVEQVLSQTKLCLHFEVGYPPAAADYAEEAYDEDSASGTGGGGKSSSGRGGAGAGIRTAVEASQQWLQTGFSAMKYSQNGKGPRILAQDCRTHEFLTAHSSHREEATKVRLGGREAGVPALEEGGQREQTRGCEGEKGQSLAHRGG